MHNYAPFYYQPTDIKISATGQKIKGFLFPSDPNKVITPKIKDGKLEFENASAADIENIHQFFIYFGLTAVLSDIEDLMRVGSNKTTKVYKNLLEQILIDYAKIAILSLSFASRMCWVPSFSNDEKAKDAYRHKFTPDKALYQIEPGIRGMLLNVETIMEVTFPLDLIKNISKIEIERDITDLKETTQNLRKKI